MNRFEASSLRKHLSSHVFGPQAMSLPGIEHAVLESVKVRDYLLSPTHPVGRFKAAFFIALGYTPARWERLRDDLLAIAMSQPAMPATGNDYGRLYVVDGILVSPTGRSAAVRTAWIIRTGEHFPRLVTAFPR
jgi:hypothetical protein